MSSGSTIITADNLSYAWAKLLDICMAPGRDELPLTVVKLRPRSGTAEDLTLREILDAHLLGGTEKVRQRCDTVAKTIFPFTLRRDGRPRDELYTTYNKMLPQLRKCPANQRGTYFQRMIAYEPAADGATPVNQLEKVINDLAAQRTRRTGLQLAIFDPTRDHINEPYLRFPCLQQVSISTLDDKTISLSALYPLHYLYERAYGNYLGLVKLAEFIARESGRRLSSVVCIAGVLKREVTKAAVTDLHATVMKHIDAQGGFSALGVESVAF